MFPLNKVCSGGKSQGPKPRGGSYRFAKTPSTRPNYSAKIPKIP